MADILKKENGYFEQGDMKFLMDREVGGSAVKNPPAMQEMHVQSLGWEDPQRREWLPTPVFLPGESHGQKSGGLPSMGLQRVGKLDLLRD